MKKYMTAKDRAEEAETLKIALTIIEIAGLDLDSDISMLPRQFAQFLIAPDAYLLIVPAVALDDGDRRRVENAMCMSKCDAIVVSVSRPSIGPKKITLEIGIDGLVPVWHSEYCARVIDGALYFAPAFDLSNGVQKGPPIGVEEGPLFGYDVGLLKMALRCVRRRAGVARPEARAAQDRFLKVPKVAVSCGF